MEAIQIISTDLRFNQTSKSRRFTMAVKQGWGIDSFLPNSELKQNQSFVMRALDHCQ